MDGVRLIWMEHSSSDEKLTVLQETVDQVANAHFHLRRSFEDGAQSLRAECQRLSGTISDLEQEWKSRMGRSKP